MERGVYHSRRGARGKERGPPGPQVSKKREGRTVTIGKGKYGYGATQARNLEKGEGIGPEKGEVS